VLTSAAGKKKRSGNRWEEWASEREKKRRKRHHTFFCPAASLFSFNFAGIITWMVSFWWTLCARVYYASRYYVSDSKILSP